MPSPPETGPVVSGATPSSADGLSVVTGLSTTAIMAHLRLRFLDPDGVPRDFPPGLEVSVRGQTYTVAAEGRLTFPAPAASPPGVFTLDFPLTSPKYVVCEAWAPGTSPPSSGGGGSPPSYPTLADAPPDTTERHFQLPSSAGSPPETWTLVHSDWTMTEAVNVAYDATEGKLQHQNTTQPIGTAGTPVVLTLDPKWLFFRFEFFDRRFGNATPGSPPATAHGARVTVPPVSIEGFRNDRTATRTNPDTKSNWVTGNDAKNLYQCLPFIMRRNRAKESLVGNLDGRHVGLKFQFPDDRYVYSESAETRSIVAIAAGDDRLKPGPERLKYYDLPRMWKSRQYYTRWTDPAVGGAFFHEAGVSTAKLGGADTRAKALTFCLDDIVLYEESGGTIRPLAAWGANDRVTVFTHRFNDTVGGPGVSKNGIYKHQTSAASMTNQFNIPQSDVGITRTPANDGTAKDTYIHDYADWSRLVVTQANLFDVFSRRAPDDADANRVVGARAAVRYIDTTARLPGVTTAGHVTIPAAVTPANTPSAGKMLSTRPSRVDRPTANPDFVLQPFHWQLCPQFPKAFNAARSSRFGRFDMVLLRCCDVTPNGEEVATNLHYIRSHWKNDLNDVNGKNRARDIGINTANRWNGDDTINNCRAVIVSDQSPPNPLRVQVVWFSQTVEETKAHFSLTGSADRSSRGSYYGNGNYTTTETAGLAHGWFTNAHESGHENGLPDDYNERWSCASYDQMSFRHNGGPGDPYEPDGREEQRVTWDSGGTILNGSMMNVNSRMRGRYFWPYAEWVSQIVGFTCQVKFTDIETVSRTEYRYKLPPHAQRNDDRSYLSWPLLNNRNATTGATPPTTSPPPLAPPPGTDWDKFQYDLYALGKDHYSQHTLGRLVNAARSARGLGSLAPAPRFDGILVIGVRLGRTFPGHATLVTEDNNRKDFATRIPAVARKGLCFKWCFRGTFGPPNHRLNNVLIHFAPQIVVKNDPHGHYAAKGWVNASNTSPARLITEYGTHFDLEFNTAAAAASRWDLVGRRLTIDFRAGNVGDIDVQLENEFAKFLGFDRICANVTVADVTRIVNLLGGSGVVVAEIT